MLQQHRAVAPKSDTITVHVPNGAPGCTDPVQVSRSEMEAVLTADPSLSSADRQTKGLARAYLRAIYD